MRRFTLKENWDQPAFFTLTNWWNPTRKCGNPGCTAIISNKSGVPNICPRCIQLKRSLRRCKK